MFILTYVIKGEVLSTHVLALTYMNQNEKLREV